MSVALYVLKCQEFTPLIAQHPPGATVEDVGSYLRVSAPHLLRLERAETGLTEAVWFAAPTGGIEGRITRFDSEVLEISEDPDS